MRKERSGRRESIKTRKKEKIMELKRESKTGGDLKRTSES